MPALMLTWRCFVCNLLWQTQQTHMVVEANRASCVRCGAPGELDRRFEG